MKTIGIIAAICVVLYISYKIFRSMSIDKGLEELVTNGAIILDVRTEGEYATGHVDGSINIPLDQLNTDSLSLDKSKTYVTVCASGIRSLKAVNTLKGKGYNVHNGGAWTNLKNK